MIKMVKIFVNNKILKKIKKPILIYSLGGGMGNVAKIVGKTIIKRYKAKKVAVIVSKAFPDVSFSNKEGIVFKQYLINLYYFKNKNKNFLVLYGDLQPGILEDVGISLEDRYNLTFSILRMIKKLKADHIVSIGGLGLEIEPENPKVFIASNLYFDKNKITKKIKEKIENFVKNNVVGMSGLFVSLSNYYKIPAYILLVETYYSNQIYGYLGAAKILDLLSKIYNFEVNLDSLIEKGRKIRLEIQKMISERKVNLENLKDKKMPYYFG
ncbi:MAG: PAC2 family protein [Nanopusillaceae archaeon]